jgi:hypothetical protein
MNKYIALYEHFNLNENESPLYDSRRRKEVEPAIKNIIIKEHEDLYGAFSVIYQFELNGDIKEIEGEIVPNETYKGGNEYKFEYSYFTDEDTETYYDMYWEEIEDIILDEFYSKGYSY